MAGKKEEGGRKSQKHSESNDDSLLENGEIIEPDFSDPEDYVDSISDEGSVFFRCDSRSSCSHLQFIAHACSLFQILWEICCESDLRNVTELIA